MENFQNSLPKGLTSITSLENEDLMHVISKISKTNAMHYMIFDFFRGYDINDLKDELKKNPKLKDGIGFNIDKAIQITEEQIDTTIFLDSLIEKLLNFEEEFEEQFFSNLDVNKYRLTIIIERINLILHIIDNLSMIIVDEKTTFIPINGRLKDLLQMLKRYLIDYELKNYTDEQIKNEQDNLLNNDKRKSIYAPTNKERLKALKEFCPELITKLYKLSRKEQEQIIHLITGVNKTDAYKKIMTADSRELDNTTIKNVDIDFEDLKSKLKNT